MSSLPALVRMAPLQLGELPDHPLLNHAESTGTKRPDLIPFLMAFLDQGNEFLDHKAFNMNFKTHSRKSAPPSNTDVEVLTYDVPESDLTAIDWKSTGVPGFERSTPNQLQTEYWFARRSYHKNISVKKNPSTASWDEFVYGLRDEHSKHESDFTPTLYDAHHILDWNEQIRSSTEALNNSQRNEAPGSPQYENITLAVYEMCHAIPWPLQPRCFPVLVATASTSANRFIAVTVPVDLSNFESAFYSNGRNKNAGTTGQQRKDVVLGRYAAVEEVCLDLQEVSGKSEEKEEIIEWVMATASDAAGNLPMSIQKASLPSQLPKDVSYFLSWIRNIDDQSISVQTPGSSTASRILRKARRSIEDASIGPPIFAP